MKTLTVGQEVCMESGCYFRKGVVVKITPSDIEVQTQGELMIFDHGGTGRGQGTYENGPRHIVD
jgi:hypothetical protein